MTHASRGSTSRCRVTATTTATAGVARRSARYLSRLSLDDSQRREFDDRLHEVSLIAHDILDVLVGAARLIQRVRVRWADQLDPFGSHLGLDVHADVVATRLISP